MYQGKFTANSKSRRKSAAAPSQVSPVKNSSQRSPASKRSAAGTRIFYTAYFLVLALLFIGIFIGMYALNGWLVRYEASQPDTMAQQVFDNHFADPDWKAIYELAKAEASVYEGADAFAAYMEQQYGTGALTYVKTSAGLSGGQKYIVRMDGTNVATFTLQNAAASDLDIPQWELDEVQVMLVRNKHVYVYAKPGQTVLVNGVALPSNHIVLTTSTVAQDYLPDGLNGAQTVLYYLDELLIAPEVTVNNADGTPVQLTYDAETETYYLPKEEPELPEGLADRMVSGVQNYCRYMIGAGGSLSTYFDTTSQIYKTITRNELWFRGYTGYEFTPAKIIDPYVYSDDLASAKVCLDLNVSRSNGTVKTFTMDSTLFMQKQNGKWMIIDMVNVDVQQQRTKVRLVCSVDSEVVYDQMVDAASRSIALPTVEAPDGEVFAGWFRQSMDENGKQTLKLVFQPDADGKITLPDGYILEPMELIARFEKQED